MAAENTGRETGRGAGQDTDRQADREPAIHKGLGDVVEDTTAISAIVPETNSLTYRGYPVQELARRCSYEEVAYLLWHGELPDADRLRAFTVREREHRRTGKPVTALLGLMPERCHPMDVLRTVVSFLGSRDPDEDDAMNAPGDTAEARAQQEAEQLDEALRLMALLPTVVAADMRRRRGQEPIAPDERLGLAANFLYMCTGEVPEPRRARAFETALILYAEHSFNASAFTARVITSTQSDLYSAVTGAIGALKGPLHGGANEAVMHAMLEIGSPENAEGWLREQLDAHRKVMGFGHRVYKNGDSRVPTMRAALDDVVAAGDAAGGGGAAGARAAEGEKWLEIYGILERGMNEATGLKPNVDYPVGLGLYLLGIDIEMFTPIFVMGRIAGWSAHVIEQREANTLIRPRARYVGPEQREVPVRGE